MQKIVVFAALLVAAAQASAQQQNVVAFVDVNVVPMSREAVVPNQTVIVRDGRIATVGPAASTQVPAGALRVDGRGKYLMPGLAEMHGHIPGPNSALTQENTLFLYVAAGATTVRGMQGHASHLPLRQRVESGEIIGPRLYLSAPPLAGNNTPTVEAARTAVRNAKAAGYDHLKVHEELKADVYEAIVQTAREVGLPWAGHVSAYVGVHGALAAGQSTIDHMDDYIEALERDNAPTKASLNKLPQVLDHIDESKIGPLANATRDARVAIVPTMPLWEVLRGMHDPSSMNGRPELRYVPPQMRQSWQNTVNNIRNNAQRRYVEREIALRNRMLKALSDGGALILLGSDAPQLYSVPGFSLQREMETMVQAGMSPFQVLASGTINVARYYGIEREAGTVEPGKRADLILLDANPLQDIRNAGRKAGVMVRGRWLSGEEIGRRLESIAASYRGN